MKINIIKQKIATLAMTGFVALLVGCNTVADREQVGQELQVTAEIVAVNTTKVFDNVNYDQKSFLEGDNININRGSTPIAADAKTYVRIGGKWKPNSDRLLITTGSDQFTATYPTEHTEILANQTTGENFWKSNMLKSTATATSNLVSFRFAPSYAKITLNIVYIANETPGKALVRGDNILATGTTGSEIELFRTSSNVASAKHGYVGILNVGATGFTVEVTTTPSGAKTYAYTASEAWIAGNNYIFNFTSKDDLILNGVSVVPFTATPEINSGNAM